MCVAPPAAACGEPSAGFWRKFVADQDPQDKERTRQRRIDSIMHDVILLEAMRRWELEHKNQEVSKDGPFSKE